MNTVLYLRIRTSCFTTCFAGYSFHSLHHICNLGKKARFLFEFHLQCDMMCNSSVNLYQTAAYERVWLYKNVVRTG